MPAIDSVAADLAPAIVAPAPVEYIGYHKGSEARTAFVGLVSLMGTKDATVALLYDDGTPETLAKHKVTARYAEKLAVTRDSVDRLRASMGNKSLSIPDGDGGAFRFGLAVEMKLGKAKDIKGKASRALGFTK